MAARKKAAKAGAAAVAARNNQYVQRLMQDEDLRSNIGEAYESLRTAYERLSNGKSPTKALLDDKKLQKNLREAAVNMRDAGEALREGPKKKRRLGRKLLLVVVGAGVALAVSEGLRKKVLDALFGAEEEFDYSSSTTTPPPETPAPDTAGASSSS